MPGKKFSQYYGQGGGNGNNVVYKGAIYEPSDFPPLATVAIGDEYSVGLNNAVISITSSGGEATAKLDSTTYNKIIDLTDFSMEGTDQPEYNGVYNITKLGSNQIKYAITGTPVSPATGSPRIRWPLSVTDNDPTKTDTGQVGYNGDELRWTGTSYDYIGQDRLLKDDGVNLEPVNPRNINLPTGKDYKINDVSVVKYTTTTPTTSTVGGIPAGTSYTAEQLVSVVDQLLHEYLPPAFISFAISGQTTPIEVGTQISGLKDFTWNTSNQGNITANSISIYDITNSATLFTGLANDGTEQYDFTPAITKTTQASNVWMVEGINTKLQAFVRNYTVSWYWRKYWGTSPNDTMLEAEIKALTSSSLSNTGLGTYSFAAAIDEYKVIAIQEGLPQPTTFKDQLTGFNVPMESPYVVSVTNDYGITTNFNIYRTTNKLGGDLTIIAS